MPDLKPVVLVVLDGWGIASPGPGNAIALSNLPNYSFYINSFPHTELRASGDAVGLPKNEAGNTETGHLNLGAGRIVYQDLERINMSIADGSFYENRVLKSAFDHALKNNSKLHLLGLVGAGGVHSNLEHLFALIRMAKQTNLDKVFVHAFTDGRDSPPTSSLAYLRQVDEACRKEGKGQIASVMGRYWAMDRDRRWSRTEKAYLALTRGEGNLVKSFEEAVNESYSQGVTDEFISPALISDAAGKPVALIEDNDAVIFFNFRIDRPRQLTAAFLVDEFKNNNLLLDFDPYLEKYEKTNLQAKAKEQHQAGEPLFDRGKKLNNLYFATMTQYSKILVENGAKVVISPDMVDVPVGRVISDAGLKQLRLTESEKERFVTYYFNGQKEIAFEGEDRLIIPSPKVNTYDQAPEMSSSTITDKLLESLKSSKYQFILVNFPNADMVGHTGNIGATIKACEAVDYCLGKIVNYILAYGGTLLITADHGNAEEMINPRTGQIDTEHNIGNVPFIAISKELEGNSKTLTPGILSDVSTTVLQLLKLSRPPTMTGRDLLLDVNKKPGQIF